MIFLLFFFTPFDGYCIVDVHSGEIKEVYNPQVVFGERFPVGSLFKVFLFLAFDYEERYFCKGEDTLEGKKYRCSVRDGHKEVSIEEAFVKSCNLFFLSKTKKEWLDSLKRFIKNLKITKKVGADIPGEKESYLNINKDNFYEVIMGQGKDVMFTPISILTLFSGIANDGTAIKPWRYKKSSSVIFEIPDKKRLQKLRHLLRLVTKQGTAKVLKDTDISGKTGTARWIKGWRTYGWFAGYFPFYSPRYAVVVFLHKGEGKDAAEITKKIVERFKKKNGVSTLFNTRKY